MVDRGPREETARHVDNLGTVISGGPPKSMCTVWEHRAEASVGQAGRGEEACGRWHWRSIRGISPGAQRPAKSLDFTLDEWRGWCRALIKGAANVMDVSVSTVLAATLRIWKNLRIQRWKQVGNRCGAGRTGWVFFFCFFFFLKREPTAIGEKGKSRITPKF